jgi:hypothetical protein
MRGIRSRAARSVLAGKKSKPWRKPAGKKKMSKVMHEFGSGKLHSGSKHGPKVTSHEQAVAIAVSEAKKANAGGYKK